jgi:hypothetical protein
MSTPQSPIKGLSTEQYLALTALDAVVEEAVALIRRRTAEVMREGGQDPGNPVLLALRLTQAGHSVSAEFAREWERACRS